MSEPTTETLSEDAQDFANRYARRIGPDEAQDLAHQAVLRALERAAPDGRTGPWLERIGQNLLIDRWRREARARRAAALGGGELPPDSPEDATLAREARRGVREGLRRLPPDLRRPLLLRYYFGLPFDCVAARLGILPATARTRVRRSLVRLRAMLGALRAWLPPLPLALQPAAVALFVMATEPGVTPHMVRVEVETPPTPALRSGRPPSVRNIPAARAQEAEPAIRHAPVTDESPATPPPAVQRFVFNDEDILGSWDSPDGERLVVVTPIAHSSLIEIRAHFLPEIVKSLEEF